MRKLYLLFAFVFFSVAYGQAPFITTWEVPTGSNMMIKVPVIGGIGVNYTIDFGDGAVLANQTGPVNHIYNTPGVYTVTVSGVFHQISFPSSNTANKLKSIEQWGDIQWTNMESAFAGCVNMQLNATDVPDLSGVTSMKEMFRDCWVLNAQVNNWDVSNITNMEGLFKNAWIFNQPLDNWNVSNVTNMKSMFYSANLFDQPIGDWDVSSVVTMEEMLSAEKFNQPLNSWDVSNVTNMRRMFYNAKEFNQPLNNWDVSSVEYMESMFRSALAFNESISDWDVSSVIDMSYMFYKTDFNQPLNSWNVSNVILMGNMFGLNDSFNQPLNNWDVSSVTTLTSIFEHASSFNQPLNDWDVSSVNDMLWIFSYATSFNQPLDNWDVSNVWNMSGAFEGASSFNQDLSTWDVSNVTTMNNMFKYSTFNQPLNNWDVSNVTQMNAMFQSSHYNQPLNDWDVSNVYDMAYMFNQSDFNQPLSNWDVSSVSSMRGMFRYSSINQNLSTWQFKPSVNFGDNTYESFLGYSDFDTENYDALLLRFVQLQLENRYLFANGLHYCNPSVRNYLITELGWTVTSDSLAAECQGNSISGNVNFDQNNNGCDIADIVVPNFLIRADDGAYNYASSTNATGEYDILVMENSYTTSVLNVPNYFTVSPQSQTVTFTGFGNEEEVNFCLTANQQVADLNVTLLSIGQARPGFASQYQLIVENIGTQTVPNAAVSLAYDNAKQSFTSALPAAAMATAGQLTFDLANLQPFESRTIAITMQTFTPPTVNGGDIIEFTAAVTPDSGDFTPADNNFVLAQHVVNSFDPNDKEVLQGDEITMEQAEGYLDYIVRFQNTGTASALTVRIEDHLPENVDWTTLRPISSSHPYKVKLKDDNTIEFLFENINLPHAAANEPASYGFIAYKVKPMETVAVGDILTGNVEIFFDYNLPIVTNFATTEIVEIMGVVDHMANSVSIYPNPVSDVLNIRAASGISVEEVKVINLQGRELMSFSTNTESINVESLSAGVYMLMIKTNAGYTKHKLVRK